MNKTAIKNFAIWARNKLIADISYRAGLMGIAADGIHAALPQSTGQTEFYDIGTAEPYAITGEAIRQRRHLVELIQRKENDTDYKTAYKYIIEEVAYTWFNRLIAVRFMEVNDYLPSHIRVLSSDTGKLEPDLVTTPFDAELEFTNAEQQTIIDLKNANKLDEVFRMLFVKQCNALNEILPALFEKTNDYTELLLNLSVIDQDGVVYHLVHDIPEEDFDVERGGQVEIIGWLYQYYNSEPKDETFALLKRNIKIEKDRIPAATQLFTPDWIVRYMVENSLGRLWVEGHPNHDLKAGWKYYVEEAEQEPEVQAQLAEIRAENTKLSLEDIKIIDPCMGSGHILVYAFDVLIQIYESAGYGQRDAARLILENNLYGLDVDDRAFQMAYFAIMMKARQYNRRILNGEYKPHVYSIQESNGINRNQLKYFGTGFNKVEKNTAINQITGLLDAFKDAKEYGSILSVNRYDWNLLNRFTSDIEAVGQLSFEAVGVDDTAEQINQLIEQGKTLARKYHVIVTNPPYMSSFSMGEKLNDYVKKNYPASKSDLFAVMLDRYRKSILKNGYIAMISMHSWMFLLSFSKLRQEIVRDHNIVNMLHLGIKAFEEIGNDVVQTTAFVLQGRFSNSYKGTYFRLLNHDRAEKQREFFARENMFIIDQRKFMKIPDTPIAYWLSDRFIDSFDNNKVSDFGTAKQGLITGDNNTYLRLWFEPAFSTIGLGLDSREHAKESCKKWFPYNKGGDYRKWYGNNSYVVLWENDGYEIQHFFDSKGKLRSRPQNMDYYFKPGITWSSITTGSFSCRCYGKGFLFDSGANGLFVFDEKNYLYLSGLLNTKIAATILKIINPTINNGPGSVEKIPVIIASNIIEAINHLVQENIQISKNDWDSYETSWDFSQHPLIPGRSMSSQRQHLLNDCIIQWNNKCEERFINLKKNEELLNRIFIDLYGFGDELDDEVSEKDISLVIPDKREIVISLLSYAVGCMLGRYSLDQNGLVYAGGEWDESKYVCFLPDTDNVIPITDEEYLEDDIVARLCTWLKVVYGEQTLEKNLDFIASALGNKGDSSRDIIRNYFLNDFFKDHCQIYSVTGSGKRPIYWLFDSGKQNGFKALIYLHRYNADTIGNLRIDYLHRMQRVYESEISRMQDMIDHSTNAREVGQATKRRDKLTKQLKECREYDEKLAHLALSRIELDLDDGVKVNYRKLQTASDGKFYEVLADSKNIMAKK